MEERKDKGWDLEKIKGFFFNKKFFNEKSLIVLLLFICVFSSVYFRSYTTILPITDDWARNSIYNNIRAQVLEQVNTQFPNLPNINKEGIVEQEINRIYSEQKESIEQQAVATSNHFRSRLQDESGQTYLLAIDPYQHLRIAENIEKHGIVGETVKDGKPYTFYQFAPVGKMVVAELHPYIIFVVYKIVNFFSPISMFVVSFWIPVLISCLCVIPAFFIARKKAGLIGGFVAGLLVGIHPVFLSRTPAGFSDNDAYVVFFALFITWFFIEGLESKKLFKRIFLIVLAGGLVGVFSFAFAGWWYVFDLLVGATIIFLAYNFLRLIINKVSLKKVFTNKKFVSTLLLLIIFIGVTAIALPLLGPMREVGRENLKTVIVEPITRSKLLLAAHDDFWPNIQTTVAELSPLSISGGISQIGGKLFFFIALMAVIICLSDLGNIKVKDYFFIIGSGVYYLVLLSDKVLGLPNFTYLFLLGLPVVIGIFLCLLDDRDISVLYPVLLVLWLVGSLYTITRGTRFLLLLVPVFSISVGVGLGLIHKYLSFFVSSWIKIKKFFSSVLFLLIILFLLINPIKVADSVAIQEFPSMNDAWWQSLEKIKYNSSEDAIINSWWDFGHWFTYVADRSVTVDGAGQEYQLAYWMGTILLSSNETSIINTLRMLDCGSRESYLTLLKGTDNDYLLSIKLLKKIIMMNESEAKETLLEQGINEELTDRTLGYIFCSPPENYLITSTDMISKSGVWGHFGAWNFSKSYVYVNSRRKDLRVAVPLIMNELKLSEVEATELYYDLRSITSEREGNNWLAHWPGYLISTWQPCTEKENNTLICRVDRQIPGTQVVIKDIMIPLNEPKGTVMSLVNYNTAGYQGGVGTEKPSGVVLYKENKSVERFIIPSTGFYYDVVLDYDNKAVIMCDPLLSESLFTKLFFLNGRYNTRFELFSDMTSFIGERIIVWKVKW